MSLATSRNDGATLGSLTLAWRFFIAVQPGQDRSARTLRSDRRGQVSGTLWAVRRGRGRSRGRDEHFWEGRFEC